MRPLLALAAATLIATAALRADAGALDDFTGRFSGGFPWVVGLDAGREESKFMGKPMMLFFVSASDRGCADFASAAWSDKTVKEKLAGYTPVVVDWDAAPDELKKKYFADIVPSVIWLDFDEKAVWNMVGAADMPKLRELVVTAEKRCKTRPPAEGYAALLESKKKLDEAAAAKDVAAQLAAIAEIRKVRLGAAVQAEAAAADARLSKEGEDALAAAQALVTAKKKADAKKALEKALADYGAEHAIGKKAKEMLDELAGKKKPAK